MIQYSNLRNQFDSHLSVAFQESIARCIIQTYQDAYQDSIDAFGEQVGMRNWGNWRLAMMDKRLLTLGMRFTSEGVRANYVNNCTSSAYHVELLVGPVCITVAHIPHSGASPPKALYRQDWAQTNEPYLFPEIQPARQNQDVYALILHSTNHGKAKFPEILRVVFPDSNGGCADEGINWYKRFPELQNVVDQLQGASNEEITEPLELAMRDEKQEEQRDAGA